MALSGAEYWMAVRAAFPGRYTFQRTLLYWPRYFRFFPSCSYTVFALPSRDTSDMPRTESSSAVSQDYLDFYYLSSARALGPNVKMGQGHKLLDPTVLFQVNCYRKNCDRFYFRWLETFIEKIMTGFISDECILNSTLFYKKKKIVIDFISDEYILKFHFCRKLQN